MSLYEKAVEERRFLLNLISKLEEKIGNAPEGSLVCYNNGPYQKWIQQIVSKDPSKKAIRRYISSKQKELAEALARKACDRYDLLDAKQELKAIDAYLKLHQEEPSRKEKAMKQRDMLRNLVHPGQSPSEELRAWQEAPYNKSDRFPEFLQVKTIRGEYVRSKSESLIALVLSNHQIPYRYECAFDLDSVVLYPDFTILHPVTKQIFLWEHFGKIDDERYYRNDFDYKLPKYIRSGYIPGKNLIMTFEAENNSLDVQLADTLARHYFC